MASGWHWWAIHGFICFDIEALRVSRFATKDSSDTTSLVWVREDQARFIFSEIFCILLREHLRQRSFYFYFEDFVEHGFSRVSLYSLCLRIDVSVTRLTVENAGRATDSRSPQQWHLFLSLLHQPKINLCSRNFRLTSLRTQSRHDLSPRTYDHGVTVASPFLIMRTGLCRSDHI